MHILSIETSCDETAVSVVRVTGAFPDATYEILGNALFSQIDIHRAFGGVFPAIAKREHAATIVPMLTKALTDAELLFEASHALPDTLHEVLTQILHREPNLTEALSTFLETYEIPEIDLIAVTVGPGLEPALWVGVNFAKALAAAWNVPVVPVNHMEGHVLASIYDVERDDQLSAITFPTIALLISGGHTELIAMAGWGQYEKIGETRDDAVGEAFDKVARLMGLPYPGGPEISRLAAEARKQNLPPYKADLPTPMLTSGDLDFSFSGLKTAVRYALEGVTLSESERMALARDFEDVVATVLLKKTGDAVARTGAQTLIVGGGVASNRYIRERFLTHFLAEFPDCTVYFPMPGLATDNAIMIALAGHAREHGKLAPAGARDLLRADGNRSLGS
jgi:N6-L-threonylcarbamoyladenine synthase